jgi:hypothetical protein
MSIVNRFMGQPQKVRPEAEYRAKRVDPAGMQAYQIDPPDRELRATRQGTSRLTDPVKEIVTGPAPAPAFR